MRTGTHNKLDAAETIPVRRLVYNQTTGTHAICRPAEKFIKGPVPLEWVSRANALPGKAGAVGLALWFLAGVQKSTCIKLTSEISKIAGCGRKAIYLAMRNLEAAELISVERRQGARPLVEIHARKL